MAAIRSGARSPRCVRAAFLAAGFGAVFSVGIVLFAVEVHGTPPLDQKRFHRMFQEKRTDGESSPGGVRFGVRTGHMPGGSGMCPVHYCALKAEYFMQDSNEAGEPPAFPGCGSRSLTFSGVVIVLITPRCRRLPRRPDCRPPALPEDIYCPSARTARSRTQATPSVCQYHA